MDGCRQRRTIPVAALACGDGIDRVAVAYGYDAGAGTGHGAADRDDHPLPPHTPTLAVTIWDNTVTAYDCGEQAAAWFSQVLGTPCRLVRSGPAALRLASKKWTNDRDVTTLFSDDYPMLLISQGSLDDLNHKLLAQGGT